MHRKFLFVSVLALLLIMGALGCGKNSTSPKKTNQNIEFSKTEISFEVGHLQEDVVLTNQSDQSLSVCCNYVSFAGACEKFFLALCCAS